MVHVLSVFVLPLISLLAGIASLYIDPHANPRKKWLLVSLMALSAAGSVEGSYTDDRAKSDSEHKMAQLIDTAQSLSKKTDTILLRLPDLGLSQATAGIIRQSISADTARAAILPSVLKGEASSNVTVAYYPKGVDGPVVINALKEGGFRVETRQGNPANASLPTNAIWVGDSVTIEQAKFVSLTLVRAGVGIVSIRRGFRVNPESKNYLVEVGTDHSLIGSQPMTAEEISALTQIPTGRTSVDELTN
jgi:hypothetical protein